VQSIAADLIEQRLQESSPVDDSNDQHIVVLDAIDKPIAVDEAFAIESSSSSGTMRPALGKSLSFLAAPWILLTTARV